MQMDIDGAEAHVLTAAIALYRGILAEGVQLGGEAADMAVIFDPIASRVEAKVLDLLYGPDVEPAEPEWNLPADSTADWHDWQAAS